MSAGRRPRTAGSVGTWMWGSTFARITQLGSHLLAGVLLVVLGTALGAALLAGLRRTLRGGNFESDHRADQPTPSALVG